MSAAIVLPLRALTLSHITLRVTCEKLAAIAAKPPKDGDDWHEDFPYGGLALGDGIDAPVHRCLSAPEAKAKLDAIRRLTDRTLNRLLADWDQLPATTLLTLETIVLSLDAQERQQGTVGQPEDWCRLDELLFRLAFRAWIDGTNFAPAPRPVVAARQIDVARDAYKGCLKRLRDELARPTYRNCQPRVDLWLGDPPRDETGTQAPRLWVSARCHRRMASEAAGFGLLPANTASQVQDARVAIYRRWLSRDDDALDQAASEELPLQLTRCRSCGKMLGVNAMPGVRSCVDVNVPGVFPVHGCA